MPRAEPKKLTEEQVIQVEALSAFLTVPQMADYFGIGRTTFFRIMERQPEVEVRYKKGCARSIAFSAKALQEKIKAGNLSAIIFHLKTKGGWRETDDRDKQEAASLAQSVCELIKKLPN